MNPPRSPRRPAARNTSPSAASRGRTRPTASTSNRTTRSAQPRKSTENTKKNNNIHSVKEPTNSTGLREHFDDFISQKRDIVITTPQGTRRISSGRTLAIVFSAALALLLVAPTFFNYLEQQRTLHQAQEELKAVQSHNIALDEQLKLWNNDEYVKAQARGRLGYVVPGETLYVITGDEEGSAADRLQARTAELQKIHREATPWYITMWDSVNITGNIDKDGNVDNPDAVPMIESETKNAPTQSPSTSPAPPTQTPTDTGKGTQ